MEKISQIKMESFVNLPESSGLGKIQTMNTMDSATIEDIFISMITT